MVSPASVIPLPFTSTGAAADLTRPIDAAVDTGVSVLAGGDVTGPPVGGVPVAVASLCTMPASTSAWVITYGAEATQVTVAPGARGPAGQVTAPTLESDTDTLVSVTGPVLVTAKL